MPIALIGLLVVVIAGVGFYVARDTTTPPSTMDETATTELIPETSEEATTAPTTEDTAVVTTPTTPTATETTPTATDTDVYKDGTYTATASYTDPGRKTYDVTVTLTVADDVVTDASVAYNGGAANTPNHTRFENGYKAEVIGKSLDSISLARVGGASLTTEAFNDAVAEIKTEAKS